MPRVAVRDHRGPSVPSTTSDPRASIWSVERNINIQGEQAVAWLGHRRYVVAPSPRRLRLFGDEIMHGSIALRRFWVSELDARREGDAGAGDALELFMPVGGSCTVDWGGGRRDELGRGSALFSEGEQCLVLQSPEPLALLQLVLPRRAVPAVREAETILNRPVDMEGPLADIFVALLTAILGSTVAPDGAEFIELERAVSAIVSAMITEKQSRTPLGGGSPAQRKLFQRAALVMRSEASDPGLDLERIAQRLTVSKYYLIRAFRESGTTPMRYLRAVRVDNALSLLSVSPAAGAAELDEIARRSGFRSARAMRDAISKEQGDR